MVEPSAVGDGKLQDSANDKASETLSQENSADAYSDKSASLLPSTQKELNLGGMDKRKFLLETKPERAPIARGKVGFKNNFYQRAAISRAKEDEI